jgi:hypothetical protein
MMFNLKGLKIENVEIAYFWTFKFLFLLTMRNSFKIIAGQNGKRKYAISRY